MNDYRAKSIIRALALEDHNASNDPPEDAAEAREIIARWELADRADDESPTADQIRDAVAHLGTVDAADAYHGEALALANGEAEEESCPDCGAEFGEDCHPECEACTTCTA